MSAEPIDAVYLWVDGSGQEFQSRLAASRICPPGAMLAAESTLPSRFRDSGELRFSLRSLERFAPWIRRIHLVTNGQLPSWLNGADPRINVVVHEALFRRETHLPTFNSNAIELQLHRIPGLTRRFLYLNDDVFFGAPTTPDTFVQPDGTQRVFLQNTPLHDRPDTGPVHDRAYAYTQRILDETWGRGGARLLPAHVPQLYDSEILAELELTLGEEFEKTSAHRFRAADDLVMRLIYFYRLLEDPSRNKATATVLKSGSREYCFARLGRSTTANISQLVRVMRLRPRFFCINDELNDSIGARLLLRVMPWFLHAMFPQKSSLEVVG